MRYKKAVTQLYIIGFLFCSHELVAHNPDFSNIIISRTENRQIILQINSSLTAFQQEVNIINGVGAYKSPEDFQKLVIDHLHNSFLFIANKNDTIHLKNTKVFLGHETKVVAEIIGLPETIQTILIKNELFKDIHNNQCTVLFLLEDFPKEKYTLSRTNKHELNLKIKDGKWLEDTVENSSFKLGFLPYLFILLAGGMLFYIYYKFKARIPK